MKKNIIIILSIFLAALIFTNISLSSEINRKEKEKQKLVNKNNMLGNYKNWINVNESELRNPFYDEVINFFDNNNFSSVNEALDVAKSKGLRCGLSEVVISEDLYLKHLIVFDTVDEKKVFFEPDTEYRAYPEVGCNYTECVFNQKNVKPYSWGFDNKVQEIIIIW